METSGVCVNVVWVTCKAFPSTVYPRLKQYSEYFSNDTLGKVNTFRHFRHHPT